MVFCNREQESCIISSEEVTILILIDGFLQFIKDPLINHLNTSHNPYFNRWFSAIVFFDLFDDEELKSQSLF